MSKDENEKWNWVTGEEYNYSQWASGEPNNYYSREFPFENVVGMRPEWNDYHEENTADLGGFICEWDYVTEQAEKKNNENGN